jgi:hypothetical protein
MTTTAQTPAFIGVCTARYDGEVRFMVSGTNVADVQTKMNEALEAACDEKNGDTFDPFDWTDFGNGLAVKWAVNATDDYAQILPMP